MSQPRFLADHDLNEFIVDGVLRREPAADFILSRDDGVHNRPDPQVLEFAASEGLIIVSHDANTMPKFAYARMASGALMSGLLIVRQLEPIGPIIESLVLIWSASEAEEWVNTVLYLPL